MKEKGQIIEVKGKLAVVRMQKSRTGACSNCGLCKTGSGSGLYLEAENSVGAREGEVVIVEISGQDILAASCLIYGIPLVGFILAVILSGLVAASWLKVIIFLVFLGGAWYAGTWQADSYASRHKPVIVARESENL